MQSKIKECIETKKLLLWCDETLFTTKTVLRLDYAAKHHNIQINQSSLDFKAEAVIATISDEYGLVLH